MSTAIQTAAIAAAAGAALTAYFMVQEPEKEQDQSARGLMKRVSTAAVSAGHVVTEPFGDNQAAEARRKDDL